MKKTLSSIAAAALVMTSLASMGAAHAEDSSVHINAKPTRHYMTPGDFAEFKNTYELTNGQMLQFTQNGNHFYTQLDNGERVRIFASSPTEFVTEAGTRIKFTDEGDTVGLSNFEKLPMAAKLPANTIMMARR
ncbi:hypothetical protein SAMN05428959_102927 [Duganella sp. CF517]|uniref:hypothetical protein n=1 Tax=Duganella sp. CF517 TaxID=1881038 RepID=UPI0008BE1A25|nr:hypothetical protein [Duganella sp. CF517]SEN69071.1 hypothetical protein SAMN05428959_102927 [Duganella sp. CF517]